MARGNNKLLKPQEAAKYLSVSMATLDKAEKQRKLRPFRIGRKGLRRYTIRMLNEYLQESRT